MLNCSVQKLHSRDLPVLLCSHKLVTLLLSQTGSGKKEVWSRQGGNEGRSMCLLLFFQTEEGGIRGHWRNGGFNLISFGAAVLKLIVCCHVLPTERERES